MRYRDLDIFEDVTFPVPNREEILRQCQKWIDTAYENCNIYHLTSPLNAIANPWIREYTASIMHRMIERIMRDANSEYRLNNEAVEMIEDDLRRITKRARTEQIWDELDEAYMQKRARHIVSETRLSQLESQIERNHQETKEELQMLRERLEQVEQGRCVSLPTTCCSYIVPNDIKSVQDIEADLRAAAEKDAPTLASYLERARTLGYLRFGRDSRRTIFDTLDERYHLEYKYDNFKKYFHY